MAYRSRTPRHFADGELDGELKKMEGKQSLGPRMRFGRCEAIESVADEMLRISMQGVTRYVDKSDILTPWKEDMRRRREILNSTGVADPAVRKGIYGRAANRDRPELNSREGHYRARSSGSVTLAAEHSYQGTEAGEDE